MAISLTIEGGRIVLKMDFADYQPIATQLKKEFFYNAENKVWKSKRFVSYSHALLPFLSKHSSVIVAYLSLMERAVKAERVRIAEKYEQLRPYQADAIARALKAKHSIGIYYDVGLGKTLIALTTLAEKNKKAVVVTNIPLLRQWEREAIKWGLFKPEDIGFLTSKKMKGVNGIGSKLLITNYHQYKKHKEMLLNDYKVFVFDEASKLKNSNTQLFRVAADATIFSEFVMLLTATPIENRLTDAYNISTLINSRFMNWQQFKDNHCIMKTISTPNGTVNTIDGHRNIKEFTEQILPFSMYKNKSELKGELPDIITIDRVLDASQDQQTAAKALIRYARKNYGQIFPIFTLLRVLDDSVDALLESKSDIVAGLHSELPRGIESSPKEEQLLDELSELGSQQVLIFAQFARVANRLGEMLKDTYKVQVMTGSTPTETRQQMVQDFQQKKFDMLIATDCLSQGVSFDDVDVLVHFDQHPNPAVMKQRDGRIHRLGSKNTKTIIRLVGGVIEGRINRILQEKGDTIDEFEVANIVMNDLCSKTKDI